MTIAIAALLVILTTGCSDALTRDTARKLILEAEFPPMEVRAVPAAFQKYQGTYFNNDFTEISWGRYGPSKADAGEISFLLDGLMTEIGTGTVRGGYEQVQFRLTERGREFLVTEFTQNGTPYYRMKLADLMLDEITGIFLDDGTNVATVEYVVRRANWTPIGDYYRRRDANEYTDIILRKVELQKYDDGWRIKR